MQYSLLDMTQRILESMESDEVNSISDTVESQAVANIIKETYWYLVGRLNLPASHQLFQLNSSGDSTKPVLMTLPSDVIDLEWLKYASPDSEGSTEFNEVTFLCLEDFLERTLNLKEDETDVDTMTLSLDSSSFTFKFYNNRRPMFYTTPDNRNIIFDGYDSVEESTLQQSNTLCFGQKIPTFTMSDSFVPELDANQFQLLLNEAKTQAFNELKQIENVNAQYRARKSFINTQRTKRSLPIGIPAIKRFRGYGRKW